MPDSEPKKEESKVTAIMVRNPDGVTVSERLKDEKGRFVKKPKPLIPTIEFTRSERKKLNSVRQDKEGLTEYMVAFMNLVRIAQNEDSDPKAMMAAVKAFEVIRQSALGKYAPSDQELDRLKVQDVKVIMVSAPQLMHPEVQEEKPKQLKEQPSFIDAEIVNTNPKV